MVEAKKEKKSDSNVDKVIYAVLILLLVAGMGLYFVYKARLNEVLFEYNGFPVKKVRESGRFFYDITMYVNNDVAPTIISIREDPRTLGNISYSNEVKDILLGKEHVYMTMEPNATGVSVAAYTEFKWIFETIYQITTEGALTEKVEKSGSPMKNCDDVDETNGVVELRKGDENRVYAEDGCVIIEAVNENDRIRGVYRLTLTMLEVLDE